jgi:protocatechuate 3,4-dioxygenase beta subunit
VVVKRTALAALLVALVVVAWLSRDHLLRTERTTGRSPTERGPSLPPPESEVPTFPGPVDLDTMDRDRDLHGVVVRKADGAPIVGAELQVVSYRWRRSSPLGYDRYFEATPGPSTRSASDGTFSFRLRPGESVALRVRADGCATLELAMRQAGECVLIEMTAGVRLTVVTRDERGDPVAGTRLRLWRTDGDAPMVRGVTDDHGRFVFAPLPGPAVYWMDVAPERLGHPGWETVRLPDQGAHEHVVTLPEGRTLQGRVTDAASGAPIPNARVGMNWVMLPFVVTDGGGRYALPGWTGKGVQDIHCVADGYGRAQRVVKGGDVHDFALSRGDSVTGRLLGADGQPVAGAPVTTVGSERRDREQQICSRSGLSNDGGVFLLSGLRRDLFHALIVIAPGHGRYLLDFDPRPHEAGTIDLGDIALPAPHTIAGRIVSDAGEPVARIDVSVTGFNADRGRLRGAPSPRDFRYGTSESRRTDDLGRFRFPDLSPGSYTLTVRRPGAPPVSRGLELVKGEDLLDVEITLPEGLEFTVTVVDEEGVPVPSVFVSVHTGNPGMNGQTDANGRVKFFVTDKVTRVTAHPFASGRGLLRANVDVEGDVDEYRLVLRRAATITGSVLDENGQPLHQAWIAAKSDGKQVTSARSDEKGCFVLKVPQGGAFDLEFIGVTSARVIIELGAYTGGPQRAQAGARDVVLRLKRRVLEHDRTLRVRVVEPDGAPAAGVLVLAGRARTKTDSDGVAEFTGLPNTSIGVNAHSPPSRTDRVHPNALTLVPAGQEVMLAFRAAATISGVVLMPDGTPAVGANIEIRQSNRLRYHYHSDHQGSFTAAVAADEPGPWTVHAELRGKGLKGRAKEVCTGAAGLRIQLK